jgi:hypothetical protein
LRFLAGNFEIRVELGDLALRPVCGLLHQSVGAGLSFRGCLLLVQRRTADAPDAREVVDLVGDVLNLQRVEHEPHPAHVVLGFFEQRVGEALFVFVELLGREAREHPAQVALQCLFRDVVNFFARAAEEALDRVR